MASQMVDARVLRTNIESPPSRARVSGGLPRRAAIRVRGFRRAYVKQRRSVAG
jgi:hypothetical protein